MKLQGAITIDLEDWRSALNPRSNSDFRNRSPVNESYMKESTKKILEELSKADIRATFFVLGDVVSAVPEIVEDISRRGHEIASHSSLHYPPRTIPRSEFERLLKQDSAALEELIGKRPTGFRAPYFAVNRDDGWLLEVLSGSGFLYDSSVVPTWTPLYGIASAPKSAYFPNTSDIARSSESALILEIPVTVWPTWTILPGAPIGGGFFMRLWPEAIYIHLLRRIVKSGHRLMLYVHPGDIEIKNTGLMKLKGSDRIVQHFGMERGLSVFRHLLKEFRLGTVEEAYSEELSRVIEARGNLIPLPTQANHS
jgi:polysaccharide deacetylase family protein (PEP-CTERM system associated)